MSQPRPRLSVLLPTAHPWPAVEHALAALLAQRCDEEFEVLLLDGHGAALGSAPDRRVRWLRSPGADGFVLRALGMAAARGEIVAFSEDHCHVPPVWCARLLAAHRDNPALALVGPIANHPTSVRRAVDRANFLLTMGPFAPPLRALTEDRLPIPTNLSIKRSVLPAGTPAPGWLEYELLATLRKSHQLDVAPETVLAHLQSWSYLRAPYIHFNSGRSYGASIRAWPRRDRWEWIRALPALPHRLFRLTRPALDRGAAGAPPGIADRTWLVGLILANAMGQLFGLVAGPGASRRQLI